SLGNDMRLDVLKSITSEVGASANQVVYAWMMQSQPPVIPLVAADTPTEMRENLGALDVKLSAEQMTLLNRAGNVSGHARWYAID
ncbi:unnamed protein product, partial [marine sediment metagenome]